MTDQPAPQTDYRRAIEELEKAVSREAAAEGIRGISVALVDDQQTVYANGFGTAKKDSIFRAGSISKVINAVAVMQLVEQGRLDLDAPVGRYGRQYSTVVPFDGGGPITLRELLCHRSGMVRESAVGGYLDDSQPTLAATVAALQSCVLLDPPDTKTRYSNAAPSMAGDILAAVAGVPYEEYQREHVLGPIGMNSSAFVLKDVPSSRLLRGYMRIFDDRGGFTVAPAPLFDLGTIPAGNLYTTVEDLAKFMQMLAAEGRVGSRRIIAGETLVEMFTPQLVQSDTTFGVGFMLGKFRGHKTVSHMGAVYGYTAAMTFLPELKLGLAVLSNEDIATGAVVRIANAALALLVEAKLGETPEAQLAPITIAPGELSQFAGEYESPSYWATIDVAEGQLSGTISGQAIRLTPTAPLKFFANGRVCSAVEVIFERGPTGQIVGFSAQFNRITVEKRPETSGSLPLYHKFVRIDPKAVPEPAPVWVDYVGNYGPSYIPLIVRIRHGHLYAMIENEYDYRLIPESENVFTFPPGMYWQEKLVFHADSRGKVQGVTLANMHLDRW